MEWRLEVGGKPFHVTADRAPNGKIAVRANGRIVAPPQSPDRVDCWFHLGTAPFHLAGNAEELQLEPVMVVEAPPDVPIAALQEPLRQQAFHPLDLRAMVFLIVGSILFLVSSCAYVGTRPRISAEEQKMVENEPEVRNVLAIGSAIRFAFGLEAIVGLLAITGAAMLIRRLPSSLFVLDIAAWSIVAGALLGFLFIDVFTHRQVDLVTDPSVAMRFLRTFHSVSYVLLVVLALASGVLTSFLDRARMRLFLD